MALGSLVSDLVTAMGKEYEGGRVTQGTFNHLKCEMGRYPYARNND